MDLTNGPTEQLNTTPFFTRPSFMTTLIHVLGDYCPIGLPVDASHKIPSPFTALKSQKQENSLIICNLESPFTDDGSPLPHKWATFRTTTALSHLLDGLDIAVLANNHICDYGITGADSTIELLRRKQIAAIGYGRTLEDASKPCFIEFDGKRLGVLSFCCPTTNSEAMATYVSPGIAPASLQNIAQSVLTARNNCDALLVYFHWGDEWVHDPVPQQLQMARYAIDCGADAVTGCHSHTIQSYEQYKGRWIFYGLGNYLFGPGVAAETTATGETKYHNLRSELPQKQSLCVTFQIATDSGCGRLQLTKLSFFQQNENWTTQEIPPSNLTFNLQERCLALKEYSKVHSSSLTTDKEPSFNCTFRNNILAYNYPSKNIAEEHGVLSNSPNAISVKLAARTLLRKLPLAKTSVALLRSFRNRGKKRADATLSREIQKKWREDQKKLPLFPSHWELYQIIHKAYYSALSDFPNLVNCRDFNDRIQWLKLFDQDLEKVRCSDKLQVRDYISSKVGDSYLTKLLGMGEHFYEINFAELPEKFALKTNHDSGTVFLVENKSLLNLKELKHRVETSLTRPYGWEYGEWAYSFIKPKIFVEEYLESETTAPPPDYKFYVVEGKVKFMHYISERGKSTSEQTVDINGNDLGIPLYPSFRYTNTFTKPKEWEEMIWLAEKLGEKFKLVRVDLFAVAGKIYTGELTFWPMYGCYKGDGQKKLGQLLNFDRSNTLPPIYHTLQRPFEYTDSK